MVNFDPDPADLALSSVPGQEAFDPRRHRFSEEELKPQPMIKKARKMLVPNEQKVLQRHMLTHMALPLVRVTGPRKARFTVVSGVSLVSEHRHGGSRGGSRSSRWFSGAILSE